MKQESHVSSGNGFHFGLRTPQLSIDQKALLLSLAVMAALCAYRAYDYWVTGFFVADEYGYVRDALTGSTYGYRWFFGWMNTLLFRGLRISGVTSYWLFLPFYLFLWAFITLFAFYRTTKLLGFDNRTVALSLISSLFVVSFVLLSLGFITEPVGLSFAMAGIYFIVKWLNVGNESSRQLILNPLTAALCFAAAEGTREPYTILPVGSMILIPLIVHSHNKMPWHVSRGRQQRLIVASFCAFLIPSLFFLQYPNSTLGGQVAPISEDIATNISQPLILPTPENLNLTVVSTVTEVVTRTFATITVISNSMTVTTTNTAITTTVRVITQVAQPPQPNFLARTRFGNTLLIFVGGLVLGWGPIMFLIGLAGFLVLVASLRRGSEDRWLVFLIALFSFGSYFVVSYIFSTDAFYVSFTNYSTIIRFSDTALPGYFLVAPFVMSRISKRKRRTLAVVAVWLMFTIAAVPLYETYASSHLVGYTESNPFALSYRTDAVQIRDYIAGHQNDAPFHIVGWPSGWDITPGTDLLRSTHVYSTLLSPAAGGINCSDFISHRWTTFYIYHLRSPGQFGAGEECFSYLTDSVGHPRNQTYPFSLVGSQIVLNGSDFALVKFDLSWG